jgi:hypothetical protein
MNPIKDSIEQIVIILGRFDQRTHPQMRAIGPIEKAQITRMSITASTVLLTTDIP